MDPPYPLRLIDAHTDHADGLSQSQEYPESWSPVVGIEPRLQALPPNISPWSYYTVPDLRLPNTSPESYYTASDLRQSNASSPQSNSYYSAVSSPSHSTTTNTDSTLSSNMSFPYSVTSINSRKSRMNVLYPRRAHPIPPPEPEPEPVPVLEPVPAPDLWPVPMPVPVPSEIFAMSHDTRIWFLCTSLLPHTETRLVPAGKVLLKSLGLGKFSQFVPAQTDVEARYCSDLFITLTHEIHLKDAVSAEELEGPCKLLHTTFKKILSKSSAFSSPKTTRRPIYTEVVTRQRSHMFRTLSFVMDTFEGALNTIKIKPARTRDGSHGDHYRAALLELSTPTGLTIEKYRTVLDQNIAQILEYDSVDEYGGWYPPSTSEMFLPPKGPQVVSTIEEGSEDEGGGSPANGQTLSYSNSRKNSLSRRIFRRLMPSSKPSIRY